MARKPKSFKTYSDIRRSINERIKRAEKAGTIGKGEFEKLPTLPKGATGTEARKAVNQARKMSDALTKAINRGRAEKRIERYKAKKEKERIEKERKKREQYYRAVIARFELAIAHIPYPNRPLSKNETAGRVLIQSWIKAAKTKYDNGTLAIAIEKTFNDGYMITDSLRYEGQTSANAGAFIDRLDSNLAGTNANEVLTYSDYFDNQYAEDGDDYLK